MKISRHWLADTVALIIFTIVTGMFIEIVIVGMTLTQSLMSRLMCQPLNIALGRTYGIYRDFIISKVRGHRKSRLRESLGDIVAYLTFQLPLYIGVLIAVGMDTKSIITALFSQIVALLILGAPYGQWLSFVRKRLLPEIMPVAV